EMAACDKCHQMLNTQEECRPGVWQTPGHESLLLLHERSADAMFYDTDHRLVGWLTPPQAVERDRTAVQVDLRTHQPVGPAWIDRERLTQHLHRSRSIGPTQVDYATSQGLPQVPFPASGKTPACGGRLDPLGPMPSQRLDMTPRTLAQVRQTRVQEPRPAAQLPRAVVGPH